MPTDPKPSPEALAAAERIPRAGLSDPRHSTALVFVEVHDIAKALDEWVADRDLEWFQIIESFAGFHPISMTDALEKGIKWAAKFREEAK